MDQLEEDWGQYLLLLAFQLTGTLMAVQLTQVYQSDINAGIINDGNPPACGFPGPGRVLNSFNDWSNIRYIAPPQGAATRNSSAANIPAWKREETINDVRQSRLVLLEGIDNAILRLASAPPSAKAADIKAILFEIRNLIGALKSEELTTNISISSSSYNCHHHYCSY